MYVSVKRPGSNRRTRVLAPSHVTKAMLANMTERTQIKMFGGVVQQRPANLSIHGKVVSRG